MAESLFIIRRLFDHVAWADAEIGRALTGVPSAPATAVREYAHIIGAEEIWLSRLVGRVSGLPVWPELTAAMAVEEGARVVAGYRELLAQLDPVALNASVVYTNSAGREFATARSDILLHVALHGQYHRGKVNLLLRQEELAPAPTDYISFVRGVPAATQRNVARSAT